ncbi:unnamed protein product, partial [Trichogramma brassicae]
DLKRIIVPCPSMTPVLVDPSRFTDLIPVLSSILDCAPPAGPVFLGVKIPRLSPARCSRAQQSSFWKHLSRYLSAKNPEWYPILTCSPNVN